MRVLSQLAPVRRLETANRLLARELKVLRLEAQLQEKTQQSIDKGQRDYYLREQLKVIRGELGENDEDAEIDEYREKIEKLHLPQEADEKLHKELQRLEKQPYGLRRGQRHPQLPRRRSRTAVEYPHARAHGHPHRPPHPR